MSLWRKIRRHPVALARNAVRKLLLDPVRYRRKDGYDAEAYWRNRFVRHGGALRGPGDEGLSERENERMYEEAAGALWGILHEEGIVLERTAMLEIGCGNGYFARRFHDGGVREYVGMDITDVHFERFRKSWPGSRFVKGDITEDRPEGTFDLVILIDVIQHIVTERRLDRALENVRACLKPGGVLLLSPVTERSGKHLFYVHWWSLDDVRDRFEGYEIREPRAFRYSHLLCIRKPEKA